MNPAPVDATRVRWTPDPEPVADRICVETMIGDVRLALYASRDHAFALINRASIATLEKARA